MTAHSAVQVALQRGELVKPIACQRCGSQSRLVGHHGDYSKPLDVEWLCGACHRAWHRENSALNREMMYVPNGPGRLTVPIAIRLTREEYARVVSFADDINGKHPGLNAGFSRALRMLLIRGLDAVEPNQ